jgi:CRISPR-associated protein Csy1
MTDFSPQKRDALRALMEAFIADRLAAKLESLGADDPKRETLAAQYEPGAWLEDAARRAGQIQVVTHTLKAIHPDAKGTNLYCLPASLPAAGLVGSHCLGDRFDGDVVGNAAALDVYKFLRLEHQGQSLLALLLAEDAELLAALCVDAEQAKGWAHAFTGITRPRGDPASHTRAKQLYWLVGDEPRNDADYQLLAPLYASSLAQRVYRRIQADRFGEEARDARQARRDRQFHPGTIHEYPQLAVQKLGGTKPQNVSQLNSERRGDNYLLASLPPSWEPRDLRLPIHTAEGSIFPGFGQRAAVRELLATLRDFLLSGPPPNVHTRNSRDELVSQLIDELLLHAAELWTFEPGWSASPQCNLNRAEQLWLDYRRAAREETFASEWKRMEWVDAIRDRFANWLNARLMEKLPVGDIENSYWAREFGRDAQWLDLNGLSAAWLEQFEREQRALAGEQGDD